MIQITRLQRACALRHHTTQIRHAIWPQPVDNFDVTNFPKHIADTFRALHKENDIQLIKIPFVEQKGIKHMECRGETRGPVGMPDIGQPCDGEADQFMVMD